MSKLQEGQLFIACNEDGPWPSVMGVQNVPKKYLSYPLYAVVDGALTCVAEPLRSEYPGAVYWHNVGYQFVDGRKVLLERLMLVHRGIPYRLDYVIDNDGAYHELPEPLRGIHYVWLPQGASVPAELVFDVFGWRGFDDEQRVFDYGDHELLGDDCYPDVRQMWDIAHGVTVYAGGEAYTGMTMRHRGTGQIVAVATAKKVERE